MRVRRVRESEEITYSLIEGGWSRGEYTHYVFKRVRTHDIIIYAGSQSRRAWASRGKQC